MCVLNVTEQTEYPSGMCEQEIDLLTFCFLAVLGKLRAPQAMSRIEIPTPTWKSLISPS